MRSIYKSNAMVAFLVLFSPPVALHYMVAVENAPPIKLVVLGFVVLVYLLMQFVLLNRYLFPYVQERGKVSKSILIIGIIGILLVQSVTTMILGTNMVLESQLIPGLLALGGFSSVFAISYATAKNLVVAERKLELNPVSVFETLGAFMALPIGIWFLQPRIKRVLNSECI